MTTNRKGRAGCNQATPNTSKHTRNSTGLAPRIKGLIVTLALWEWLLVGLADWFINLGGSRND